MSSDGTTRIDRDQQLETSSPLVELLDQSPHVEQSIQSTETQGGVWGAVFWLIVLATIAGAVFESCGTSTKAPTAYYPPSKENRYGGANDVHPWPEHQRARQAQALKELNEQLDRQLAGKQAELRASQNVNRIGESVRADQAQWRREKEADDAWNRINPHVSGYEHTATQNEHYRKHGVLPPGAR